MGSVPKMIVVLGVLASLFVLAPCCGTLVSCAEICRTAGVGAHGAEGYLTLHAFGSARRTCSSRTVRPFEILKLLFTFEALILKNGHRTSIP